MSTHPTMSTDHFIVQSPSDDMLDMLGRKGIGTPETALILGSGYAWFTDLLEDRIRLPYAEVPDMPASTVAGHSGHLDVGVFQGQRLLVFSGRFHHYEGYPFEQVTLPVRLAHRLGCRSLIITNAAGGIREGMNVGDLMLIRDILRTHPVGLPASQPFRMPALDQTFFKKAKQAGLPIHEGTYLYVKGPSYETPAEIRAFRTMGADAVGMSTVPEITEAVRLGLPFTAFSLITNAAAGMTEEKLDHSDISQVGRSSQRDVESLIRLILAENS